MYAVSVYLKKKKLPSIRQGPGRARVFTSLLVILSNTNPSVYLFLPVYDISQF